MLPAAAAAAAVAAAVAVLVLCMQEFVPTSPPDGSDC